jgi:Tfp pilus assembly protein PilZ
MHILKVRFRTNTEFSEAYLPDLGGGGLFCPTTTELRVGTPVICELSVPALPNKVLIRGVVRAWRPALPRLRVRAGATVEFDRDESDKRDFVVGTVKGEREAPPRRRHTRLPVELRVKWKPVGTADYLEGALSEISVGGALLTALPKKQIGDELVIELTPPGAVSPLAIAGKVSYHSPTGAMGVKFQVRDGGGLRRLRELVRRLRAS